MAFSAKHLAAGEHVELELHTHLKRILLPVLVLIATVVVAAVITWLLPDSLGGGTHKWALIVIWVLALLVVIVWVLAPILRWRTTLYVITNRRLITRYGIMTKSGRDIPLFRINDVSYEKGLMDRVLGCGTLVIADASEQAGLTLDDVPHVEQVQVRLNELLFAHDDAADDDRTFPPGEPRGPHRDMRFQ
ncbi:PH domain-containing protein [Leekyejoonella antrihumi]|uniref:PH domain-containing protein n=1 Tax=Leekyejoonella antrihumi TaxID=1660198 RepID=A0A563E3H3_9MICO|nr:PH domain-containing protein [Leekyejoonella antrihumi]TWP36859.1 PH domain-containing protein [Leekyejoonella antrihumi]